jgi:holo-[acyl-carrier protein] synthase
MPVRSLGIDVVEIARIRSISKKYGERFLNRIFTETELSYCHSPAHGLRFESLAARFAAKEAFYKAASPLTGSAFSWIPWHACEVVNNKHGAPGLQIAHELHQALKQSSILLSLSHTRDYAVAVVVIE